MSDLDMGEQFLNCPLHGDIQEYCGIDVRPYFAEQRCQTLWLRWTRCMMGLKSSPYVATKATYLGEEVAVGDRTSSDNPMHWSRVHLNLPGSEHYDPTMPWVQRLKWDGSIAGAAPRYVDNMWPVGASESMCWEVTHQMVTYYSYLGMQITGRKSQPPSQEPGPWAGTLAFVCPEGIGIACLFDK